MEEENKTLQTLGRATVAFRRVFKVERQDCLDVPNHHLHLGSLRRTISRLVSVVDHKQMQALPACFLPSSYGLICCISCRTYLEIQSHLIYKFIHPVDLDFVSLKHLQ